MCNKTGIDFGRRAITTGMVRGRDVIEVGSLDVNGSLRSGIEALGPRSYIGVDLGPGPGVDEVVDATALLERFGPASFDLVVSTEMIEHTRDWQTVIHNLKAVLRPGGHLLVTTRSPGFPFHAWPYDFWRYDQTDMEAILGDLEIVQIEPDTASPGIFVLARRPVDYIERTPRIPLMSIITARREVAVTDRQVSVFRVKYRIRRRLGLVPGARRRTPLGPRLRAVLIHARNRLWRSLPESIRSRVKRLFGR